MEFLIVGLGNPGVKYKDTRHNLGFMVVQAFAEELGLKFKRGWKLKGQIAHGEWNRNKIHLLLPTTYMNLSGGSVRSSIDYYRIGLSNIAIVVDDVYLKLGSIRFRSKGSAGGHNGLKSVEKALGTQEYSRLRMGVGGENLSESSLEDYVLGTFSVEEKQQLPQVIENGVAVLKYWIDGGIDSARQRAGESIDKPQNK